MLEKSTRSLYKKVMRNFFAFFSSSVLSILICTVFYSFLTYSPSDPARFISPVSDNFAAGIQVLGITTQNNPYNLKKAMKNPINILLLGLDSRKGEKSARCDAIHMISIDFEKNKITINSIPRGTPVDIPNTPPQTSYLANSCSIGGFGFAIDKIEKILNIKEDYVIKVGFSQTLGIFRTVGLPTTTTLEFLRNRRYGVGDNQRSHNQQFFIKQMTISHLKEYYKLPKSVKYLLYKMVDTDMDYETADFLASEIINRGISDNEDNIDLNVRLPKNVKIRDISYDEEKINSLELQKDDADYDEYQNNLKSYIENLILRGNKNMESGKNSYAYQIIKIPFQQKIWLQVDDEQKRTNYEFSMLKIFAGSSPDKSEASSKILDFVTEMETQGYPEMITRAKDLLPKVN